MSELTRTMRQPIAMFEQVANGERVWDITTMGPWHDWINGLPQEHAQFDRVVGQEKLQYHSIRGSAGTLVQLDVPKAEGDSSK